MGEISPEVLEVLQISKDENDSNEVAVTYSLESAQLIEKGERYLEIAFGAEHDVDPLSDSTWWWTFEHW